MLGLIYHRPQTGTIDTALLSSDNAYKSHYDATVDRTTAAFRSLLSSFTTHLSNVPTRATSHVDPQHDHKPITKQQLIEPMVIPNVAGFSVATIPQGHEVTLHQHDTMHEFFYVLEGSATFSIIKAAAPPPPDGEEKKNDRENGKQQHGQLQQIQYTYTVQPGSFVYVAPPDRHRIQVAADSPHGDFKMLVAGIIVE
jgi:quercetin dioxygenase-like cupin family protein